MAQFTTQGRLKLLFNGEGVSSILEQKDPFLYKCRSLQTNKRRTRCTGSSARIYYASTSSLGNKSHRCNARTSSSAGNGRVHDEYDEDEDEDDDYDEDEDVFDQDGLSCFRGLVLDIAYRLLFFLQNFACFLLLLCMISNNILCSLRFTGIGKVHLGFYTSGWCYAFVIPVSVLC